MQPGWGAGTGDGSALPSPGSCGMRTGMVEQVPSSPGKPTPALPQCLEYLGWGAPLKLFQLCLSGLVQVPLPQEALYQGLQLRCGLHPHICPVGPHGPELPLYTPTTVISWRDESHSGPNLPGCLGPGQGPVHCGFQPFLEGLGSGPHWPHILLLRLGVRLLFSLRARNPLLQTPNPSLGRGHWGLS